MNESNDNEPDSQLRFLEELLEENTSIDGDVLEIGNDTWAIHGVLPYDGEVPIAVFHTYDEAKHVLDDVRGPTPGRGEGI